MVKSDAGEDKVAYCETSGYATNVEVAASRIPAKIRDVKSDDIREVSHPNIKSIDELCEFFKN